jgi:hypothetical protein
LNARLNFRLVISTLQVHGHDLIFVSTEPAAGQFARIFVELVQPGPDGAVIMIDSTHLKAHRTAASLSKGGRARGPSDGPKAD